MSQATIAYAPSDLEERVLQQGKIVYFGHDRTDSKVIQRIEGFMRLGLQVCALTFRREKYNRHYQPRWTNVDLGTTVDAGYWHRVIRVFGAVSRSWRVRRELGDAEFMVARNLDMAVLAVIARWMAGAQCPLAYEVLDVHRFLMGHRTSNRLFRWLERRILARVDLVIVSSPAYLRAYFEPVQRYHGPWFLLENKVAPAVAGVQRPRLPRPVTARDRKPWVIGWCGTLRCVRSLDLLIEIARRYRERVLVYTRGFPTETGLEEFQRGIAHEPNVLYGGGYKSPEDLAEVYSGIDLNWCVDYYDASKNSMLLLPNRLYEGGFFNVPALGLAGTEVGRKIEAEGLGWVVEEPVVESIGRLLETLTPDVHAARVAHLGSLPDDLFADTGDLARLSQMLLSQRPATARRARPA